MWGKIGGLERKSQKKRKKIENNKLFVYIILDLFHLFFIYIYI